ncbi:MAG TPA: MarR family transcriptional regulator [Mucilaginibacter sp.]|jgi:DNA-binding MarR family transcriptional regulator|nr:MarR family transcriptional regulator [Mucilaginibacter sp.]
MNVNQDLQLASALRTGITRLVKKLRKESPTGLQLSFTERSTLAALYQHKSLLPSELAAMEMITNQSMSQVLNHLFELGFITRTASDTDKRKVIISLTPEGERTLTRVRNERDEWLARAINETCTPAEQNILKQALAPLNKLVDFK